MTIRIPAVAAALAFATAIPAAGAGDAPALAQSAASLQREVAQVRVQLAQALPQAYINASEERFNQLDRQVRDLTGRMERLEIQIRQLIQQNERQQSDLELRLSEIEQRGGRPQQPQPPGQRGQPPRGRSEGPAQPTPPTPPTPPVAQIREGLNAPAARPGEQRGGGDVQMFNAPAARPGEPRMVLERGPEGRALGGGAPAAQPAAAAQQAARPATGGFQTSGAAEDDYEDAYEIVREVQARRANPGEAEQAMRSFAQAYPNHRLANDARFWQGEMLYRQRNYPQAQTVFAGLLQRAPNSERAPETMLRLAQSMRAPNQRQQACGMLTLISQRYPQASQRVKSEATQERTRLRCQT